MMNLYLDRKTICDDIVTIDDLLDFCEFFKLPFEEEVVYKDDLCEKIHNEFYNKKVIDILFDIIKKTPDIDFNINRFLYLKDKLIKFILKLGISVDDIISFHKNRTVLMHALYNNKFILTETLEYLLSLNPYMLNVDYNNKNLLMYGLSGYTPDGSISEQLIYKMFRLYKLQDGNPDAYDDFGSTILLYAINSFYTNSNDIGIINILTYILLKFPPKNINHRDNAGYNAFHKSVMFPETRLPYTIINLILDFRPNINNISRIGTTPLYSFMFNEDFDSEYNEIIQRMIDMDVDPIIYSHYDNANILMGMLKMNFDENRGLESLFTQFIYKITRIDPSLLYHLDNFEQNLLIYGLSNTTIPETIMKFIIKSNQDCNIIDKHYGQTPLMIATAKHISISNFEYILNNTSDDFLNVQDYNGFSVLMHVISSTPFNILKFKKLIERNIDFTQRNKFGHNVIDFAEYYNLDNAIKKFLTSQVKNQESIAF